MRFDREVSLVSFRGEVFDGLLTLQKIVKFNVEGCDGLVGLVINHLNRKNALKHDLLKRSALDKGCEANKDSFPKRDLALGCLPMQSVSAVEMLHSYWLQLEEIQPVL